MLASLPEVYAVTNVSVSGLSHVEQVKRLIEGGASLIQLREKNLSTIEFYRQAEHALILARQHRVRLIINDRVDIALALGADGVHLGQDDMPPAAARRLLGEDSIIGFSTHNEDQARRALGLPISYLAVGPIFPTSTKLDTAAEVGLERLGIIRGLVGNMSLVAIGGISELNAETVIDAGADSVALIGALLSDPAQIATRTRFLLNTLKSRRQ
jgi:thiamine-phosphate pyrophosphorylase